MSVENWTHLVEEGRDLTELGGERPHVLLADGDGLPGVDQEHVVVRVLLLDGQTSLPEILVKSEYRLLSAHSPGAVSHGGLVVHEADQLDVVLTLNRFKW